MIIFEISSGWVKALWGRSILKDVQISGVTALQLKSDSKEELVKTVSPIVDKKTFKRYKPITLSIPRNQVTLRNLKFPSRDEKELDNIINLHITQQVPYSRDEIVYNYAVLEKAPSGFAKVLLGIVHREVLKKQFSIFERINLYPENIQLSSSGLVKFLRKAKVVKDGDKELKACLDIDVDFSDFLIFRGSEILFSKSVAIGREQLEQPDKLPKFIGELKQALVVFQTEMGIGNPAKLYITGAVPAGTTFKGDVASGLQLEVETINPVDIFGSLKEIKGLADISKKISICALLGVATDPLSKKLNFVLPEAKLKKDVRDTAKNLILAGSIIFYLIVLLIFSLIGKMYSRQIYMNKLNDNISILEFENKDAIDALDKIKIIKNFSKPKKSFLYYYYELSKVIPVDITIDRMIFNRKEEFSFIGKGTDMGEIFKFVRVLNKAEIFGKIELKYSRKKTKGESEFNEFEVVCHLEEKSG